jgi:hypothetical protein
MMPTYRYATSQPLERDDIEFVNMFLSQFKDEDDNSYVLKARPDDEERKAKAVEPIAVALFRVLLQQAQRFVFFTEEIGINPFDRVAVHG